MQIDLAAATEDFWSARGRGEFFPPAYFDRLTIDDAYRIQLALVERRVQAGESHVGWKVGLTAKAIQDHFGFHEPVFACVLETHPTGHTFNTSELINPSFETELCMRLACDLEGAVTLEQARAAVDLVYPSFEIVEARGDTARHMAVSLADNAQQRSVIIGAPVRLTPDMAPEHVSARVQLNGQEVALGLGSEVLGNPVKSIAWLSGKLGEYGRRLRSGDIIMTGSIVRQFPLAPGDIAAADFSGIGRVEVRIAPRE